MKPDSLLKIGDSSLFGQLDHRNSSLLINLAGQAGINFQIWCKPIGRQGTSKKTVNDIQYVVNVIIYGPQDICDDTGDYLRRCGIFLQDPVHCNRDVTYQNPHLLARSDNLVSTFSLQTANNEPRLETVDSSEDIFSQLSSDDHLPLTEAPQSIATPLYP
jgi:hypothetical protein